MNIEITVLQKSKIFWPFPLTTALFRVLQKYFDYEFEFHHQYHQENATYLSMSVYSNLDENRIDVDKNAIVQDYLVKMANFIAFYRVPNFEELRFVSICRFIVSCIGVRKGLNSVSVGFESA